MKKHQTKLPDKHKYVATKSADTKSYQARIWETARRRFRFSKTNFKTARRAIECYDRWERCISSVTNM